MFKKRKRSKGPGFYQTSYVSQMKNQTKNYWCHNVLQWGGSVKIQNKLEVFFSTTCTIDNILWIIRCWDFDNKSFVDCLSED